MMRELKEFYYLNFCPVAETRGAITNVIEHNAITGGISFEYQTNYMAEGKKYEKAFLNSPESLGLQTGDSVVVSYAITKPGISILAAAGFNWKGLLWSLAGLTVILIFLVDALVKLFRNCPQTPVNLQR